MHSVTYLLPTNIQRPHGSHKWLQGVVLFQTYLEPEGGREEGRKGGREGGREGVRREGGREGGRGRE